MKLAIHSSSPAQKLEVGTTEVDLLMMPHCTNFSRLDVSSASA